MPRNSRIMHSTTGVVSYECCQESCWINAQVVTQLLLCNTNLPTKFCDADAFHDFGQKKDPRKNEGRTEGLVRTFQLTEFIDNKVPKFVMYQLVLRSILMYSQ